MIKSWSDEAWEDFEYWTKQDRKTLKRILFHRFLSTHQTAFLNARICPYNVAVRPSNVLGV